MRGHYFGHQVNRNPAFARNRKIAILKFEILIRDVRLFQLQTPAVMSSANKDAPAKTARVKVQVSDISA